MDGLMMLLAMAVFFGLMYLYCWMPDLLDARRKKRKEKDKIKKVERRKIEKIELQKTIDDKSQVIHSRREKIQEHMEWLNSMNRKIKERFDQND